MNTPEDTPGNLIPRAEPVRTLIVDDSPLMPKTLARILAPETGFQIVGIAANGREAIRCTVALEPELILMDIRMPRMDGFEATHHIKRLAHPPAVIIVTSDDSTAARARARALGADGFVTKSGDLHAQLQVLLGQLFHWRSRLSTPCQPCNR